jgi:hypothetical protein
VNLHPILLQYSLLPHCLIWLKQPYLIECLILGEIRSAKFVDRDVDGGNEINVIVRAGDENCGVNSTGDIGELLSRYNM